MDLKTISLALEAKQEQKKLLGLEQDLESSDSLKKEELIQSATSAIDNLIKLQAKEDKQKEEETKKQQLLRLREIQEEANAAEKNRLIKNAN